MKFRIWQLENTKPHTTCMFKSYQHNAQYYTVHTILSSKLVLSWAWKPLFIPHFTVIQVRMRLNAIYTRIKSPQHTGVA